MLNKSLILLFLFFITSCSSLFYQPSKQFFYNPESLGYDKINLFFESKDHEKIHAWFFKTKNTNPKGTILQFHGNAENISTHFMSTIWLVDEGYNLLIFDYRGYGESTGTPNQHSINQDALIVLDKALEFHSSINTKNKKFIVLAQSLGGVIAMRALQDFENKSKIDLIILDSTFMSYKDLAQEKLASSVITWIFSPLGQVLVSDQYASKYSVSNNQIPTLVLHDIKDPVVGFQNGLDLYSALNCKKELWVFDQAQHVGSFSIMSIQNRKRLMNFLNDFVFLN